MDRVLQFGNVKLYFGALPPGLLLDALVAEHVLGWKRHDWTPFDHPCIKNTLYCHRCGLTKGINHNDDPSEPWSYFCNHKDIVSWSTDISDALDMAEGLGKGITLFRNLWANGVWHWHCHIDGPIDEPGENSVEVESAAHAICLAALLAVQHT